MKQNSYFSPKCFTVVFAGFYCMIMFCMPCSAAAGKAKTYHDNAKEAAARTHFENGNAYLDQKQYDEAYYEYTQCIALKQDAAPAYCNRAQISLLAGDYANAAKDFKKVLHINPSNYFASKKLADIYMKKGDNSKAVAQYTRTIKLNSKDHQSFFLPWFMLYRHEEL